MVFSKKQLVKELKQRMLKDWKRHNRLNKPPLPASSQTVEKTEASLGFKLPDFLKELYLHLANGGFGPEIIGLEGGYAYHALFFKKYDSTGTLLDWYHFCREVKVDATWQWPEKLLPLYANPYDIWFCLDCTNPEKAAVICFDAGKYLVSHSLDAAFETEADSLEEWLEGWLEYEEEVEAEELEDLKRHPPAKKWYYQWLKGQEEDWLVEDNNTQHILVGIKPLPSDLVSRVAIDPNLPVSQVDNIVVFLENYFQAPQITNFSLVSISGTVDSLPKSKNKAVAEVLKLLSQKNLRIASKIGLLFWLRHQGFGDKTLNELAAEYLEFN